MNERHVRMVHDEGALTFYLVEENRVIGNVYDVRMYNRCHWRSDQYHADGVAEVPHFGDGVVEYSDYVIGGTAFRTEREALVAAISYSLSGLQRVLDQKASVEHELKALEAKLAMMPAPVEA